MNELLAEMAAVSSRRKQSKPRRMSGEGDAMLSPIDLSTKHFGEKKNEKFGGIPLEDKSNLLAHFAPSFADPQQFLSLCAQLGNPAISRNVSSSASSSVTSCPIQSCSQSFGSTAALTWHILDVHEDEQEMLFNCNSCGTSFSNGQDIRDHKCSTNEKLRSSSVPPATNQSSICFLSTPSTPIPAFSINESMAATSSNQQEDDEEMEGEDEEEETAQEHHQSQLFGNLLQKQDERHRMNILAALPQFAAFPNMPPPFLIRQNFEPRQEMFAARHENDDDWEALMEISTSDESEKIRALVGDKAIPTTDPNQCILCRRVLSCKSALQMHYRTHTGERPFKCKICQRAFTTKGNLKTHMGVHRSKHSFRGLPLSLPPQLSHQMPPRLHLPTPPSSASIQSTQQCPICPKRLMNTSEMAAHIAEHRNSLTQPPRMMPTPPSMTRIGQFPFMPFFTPPSLNATDMSSQFNLANILNNANNQFKRETSPPPQHNEDKLRDDHPKMASLSPTDSSGSSSSVRQEIIETNEIIEEKPKTILQAISPNEELEKHSPSLVIDDSKVGTNENPLVAMQKMWAETEPPPPRQLPVLSKHQCGVCFKHFSSSSALQIHMRTHTGDKPFKCDMCGRAFTTRGNLKVHMGTHAWQQSPSRRGRRIFDVASGTEKPIIAPQPPLSMANPTVAAAAAAAASPLAMLGQTMPNIEMMMMLWRTVCSVCQKVCSSPGELETHLKEHLNNSSTPNIIQSATTPPPS